MLISIIGTHSSFTVPISSKKEVIYGNLEFVQFELDTTFALW